MTEFESEISPDGQNDGENLEEKRVVEKSLKEQEAERLENIRQKAKEAQRKAYQNEETIRAKRRWSPSPE